MNCTTNSVAKFSYCNLSFYAPHSLNAFTIGEGILTKSTGIYVATILSSNGHEKTKETSKYKNLLISKRRIRILKKLPKQGEDSESL